MNSYLFQKYQSSILLLIICLLLTGCSSNEETEIPSIDNDFLGNNYFYYQFDGKEEYEYWNRIFIDPKPYDQPPADFNVISGPSVRAGVGELEQGQSEDFSISYYFWLPVNESQVQDIVLPFRSETTSFIGFPQANIDGNLIFQLSFNINEGDTPWRSLTNDEWSNLSSEDFQLNNYHMLNTMNLLDSSDPDLNIYQIEGEFEANVNRPGTTLLKPVSGKYKFQLIVCK